MPPMTEVTEVDMTQQLLTISGGDKGIDYGGVDEDGVLEPASRDDFPLDIKGLIGL